ncbi:MAG: hypothetical protein HQL43_10250 [Alphaproteobacteria bacterium]|nr:hypothetical protein [Alphaproteobacteria bacterium]
MSGWGCPHESKGQCEKVKGKDCSPGMRGCILHGRFRFVSPEKNAPETVRKRLREQKKTKLSCEDDQ